MKIVHATEPFKLSPSRSKRRDAHAILQRAAFEPNLATQALNAHNVVVIGGVPTYWSPPPYEGAPRYIATMDGGNERFIFLDANPLNVAIFDGRDDLWLGRVLTCLPELVLAVLPNPAVMPFGNEAVASSAQRATIVRLLNLPANHSLPRLHAAVASLVIQRIVFADIFPRLVDDFRSWTDASIDEHAA
jgi:hypothetical protein